MDKIKFKKSFEDDEEMVYNPEKKIGSYYQICKFKAKFTKKYQTRKIIFNEYGDILKIYEREYSLGQLEKFMKHHRSNKYKIHPTYDISIVSPPTSADFICVRSELLNNNNKEYDNEKITL